MREPIGCAGVAIPDKPGGDQLRLWINPNPCPAISNIRALEFGWNVFLLGVNKGPNLIAFNASALKVSNPFIVEDATGFADLYT